MSDKSFLHVATLNEKLSQPNCNNLSINLVSRVRVTCRILLCDFSSDGTLTKWHANCPTQIVNSVKYKVYKYLEKSGGVSGDNNSIL